MEKKVPEKKTSNLAKLVGSIVIGVAALLPLSGCYEEYGGSTHYNPAPRYYSPPRYYQPLRYYPQQRPFNNGPYGNPPPRHYGPPPQQRPSSRPHRHR